MSLDVFASKPTRLQLDNLKTREVAQRWATLAEQRLSYLTELFDTGRWRRFHNEVDFLENIQEAKSSMERWRAMADGEFVAPVIREALPVRPILAAVEEQTAEAAHPEAEVLWFEDHALGAKPHRVAANLAAVIEAPDVFAAEPVTPEAPLDLFDRDAIVERYPMLRAAM